MGVGDKISKLIDALATKGKVPKNLRVLLIDSKRWLRSYGEYFGLEARAVAFSFVDDVKCERGSMLDAFAKIEFIIKELMLLKLLGSSYPKGADLLDDIIDKITHKQRISILKRWQVIDKELAKMLRNLNDVRNDIAHSWDLDEVKYGDKRIKESFPDLKAYLKDAWQKLIAVYEKEETNIDVDNVLAQVTW